MRIKHSAGHSFIQGTVQEKEKIVEWIELASCEIMVDDCDDEETSYTVVSKKWDTTQKERSLDFKYAKKEL